MALIKFFKALFGCLLESVDPDNDYGYDDYHDYHDCETED